MFIQIFWWPFNNLYRFNLGVNRRINTSVVIYNSWSRRAIELPLIKDRYLQPQPLISRLTSKRQLLISRLTTIRQLLISRLTTKRQLLISRLTTQCHLTWLLWICLDAAPAWVSCIRLVTPVENSVTCESVAPSDSCLPEYRLVCSEGGI